MAIPSLTLRSVKGSALTFAEADSNFQTLANAKVGVTAGGTTSNVALNGDTGAPTSISFANSATITATQSSGTVTHAFAHAFAANVNGNGFNLQNTQLDTYRERVANISSALTGTVTIDANVAPIQTAAVTGNITINTNNLTNFLAGESVTLILNHTANTRTLTSNLQYVNGSKTIGGTTNVTDVITIFCYQTTPSPLYLATVAKFQL